MKTLRLFLYTIIIFLTITATQWVENEDKTTRREYRVFLTEKANLPLKEMPLQLLKAWCQGYLKAYLSTNNFSEEAGYINFLKHYGISYNKNIGASCEEGRCGALNINELAPFVNYMDVVEENDKIKFVRLVFSKDFSDFNSDHFGPVFKFDDILQLPVEQFYISNTSSKYANYKLAHLLAVRKYQSVEIDAEGNIIVYKDDLNERRVNKQDGEQQSF